MLVLSRKEKEEIHIGNDVTITILRVKGHSVRIGINAPKDIRVIRGELQQPNELDSTADELSRPEGRTADKFVCHSEGECPTIPTTSRTRPGGTAAPMLQRMVRQQFHSLRSRC